MDPEEGGGGGKGSAPPPPPEKSQKYRVSKQCWSGSPEKSQGYKASFHCWAIIVTPAKRHLNGSSMLAHLCWYLDPLFPNKKNKTSKLNPLWQNFLDHRMKNIWCLSKWSITELLTNNLFQSLTDNRKWNSSSWLAVVLLKIGTMYVYYIQSAISILVDQQLKNKMGAGMPSRPVAMWTLGGLNSPTDWAHSKF